MRLYRMEVHTDIKFILCTYLTEPGQRRRYSNSLGLEDPGIESR
jgi:hypothetical protein